VNPWIVAAVIVAASTLGLIAHRFGWIDLSNKIRSGGTHGGALGVGDEVFNPTRYEAQLELDRQTILPAPAPVAGDGDKGIYSGSVKIEL
jgi:hypothetical protein